MKFISYLSLIILLSFSIMNSTEAQDWANLNKYKAANEQLDPPVHRIVFMGNSITEGWIHDSLNFFDTKGYINRGISGQTTPQMLVRFRPDVIYLQPSVVVILAGINDIAENTGPSTIKMIADNIMSMSELAEANGIKVVLSSVLPAYDFPWRPGLEPAKKVIKLNQILKDYAQRKGMVYLDYFSKMVDDRNGLKEIYTYDGVHPNLLGYRIMEPLAKAAIEKALRQK